MFGSIVRSKFAVILLAPIVAASFVVATPLEAFGTSATKPVPAPVVLSFTATKANIPNTGGSFTLKARLKYAQSCVIAVTPALNGFPKTFSCSSDKVSKLVSLKENVALTAIAYSFSLDVTNKTASTSATNIAVTEAAGVLPVVASFKASEATLPNTGGTFALKAKLRSALSCKITVSPALKSFPRKLPCSSGSLSQDVTLADNPGENPIAYTFSMSVVNKSGSVSAANVVVTQAAAPAPISFSTPNGSSTTLVFADEGVFVADDPLIITVHNNASTTQLITTVAIGTTGDPSDFLLNRNNCSYVTAHSTCSLAVQFQPSGAGHRTGVVNLLDASWGTAGATVHVDLSGYGVWAVASVTSIDTQKNTLVFPGQYGIGAQSPEQFMTLTNTGAVPLYVDGLTDTGGNYGDFIVSTGNCQTEDPQIISVGQTCTFGITFDPSSGGFRASNVVVDDNTLGTQTQLVVQGTGEYSSDTLTIATGSAVSSPTSYAFSPAYESVPVYVYLTVTNTSAVTLVFGGVGSSGLDPNEFAVVPTGTCGDAGVQLAAGASCTAQLEFDPATTGARSATVDIRDNTPAGSEIISLTGTGIPPPV